MTPEAQVRIARSKRLSKLRLKAAKGDISEAEQRELDNAPPPKKFGRPRRPAAERLEAAETRHQESASAETAQTEPVSDAVADTPPPPPAVEVIPAGRARDSSDWRTKYQGTTLGGREGLCVQAATLYCAGLARLSKYIKDAGSTPLMDEDAITRFVFPAAVLTFDKFMPDVDVGPEVEMAIGSGLLLGQAAIVAARKKREAQKPRHFEPRVVKPQEPEATSSAKGSPHPSDPNSVY